MIADPPPNDMENFIESYHIISIVVKFSFLPQRAAFYALTDQRDFFFITTTGLTAEDIFYSLRKYEKYWTMKLSVWAKQQGISPGAVAHVRGAVTDRNSDSSSAFFSAREERHCTQGCQALIRRPILTGR
jgi:hypothetical protein